MKMEDAARRQGPQGADPKVRVRVLALVDQGMTKSEIARDLHMHMFQVSVARAIGNRMVPGPMRDYFVEWARKYGKKEGSR